MLSQFWKGSSYSRRRGEVQQLSAPFQALLDHRIILCLLALSLNKSTTNLQTMQFSGFFHFEVGGELGPSLNQSNFQQMTLQLKQETLKTLTNKGSCKTVKIQILDVSKKAHYVIPALVFLLNFFFFFLILPVHVCKNLPSVC